MSLSLLEKNKRDWPILSLLNGVGDQLQKFTGITLNKSTKDLRRLLVLWLVDMIRRWQKCWVSQGYLKTVEATNMNNEPTYLTDQMTHVRWGQLCTLQIIWDIIPRLVFWQKNEVEITVAEGRESLAVGGKFQRYDSSFLNDTIIYVNVKFVSIGT